MKDTKYVNNTIQIRGEREVAKNHNKEFIIVTGEKTHVSSKIPEKKFSEEKILDHNN